MKHSSLVDDELTTFSKIRREIPRNVVTRNSKLQRVRLCWKCCWNILEKGMSLDEGGVKKGRKVGISSKKSLYSRVSLHSVNIHDGKRKGTGSMVQYTLVRVYVCHVNRPIATQVQRPAELQHCCIDAAIRRSLSQHAQVPRGALSLPVR